MKKLIYSVATLIAFFAFSLNSQAQIYLDGENEEDIQIETPQNTGVDVAQPNTGKGVNINSSGVNVKTGTPTVKPAGTNVSSGTNVKVTTTTTDGKTTTVKTTKIHSDDKKVITVSPAGTSGVKSSGNTITVSPSNTITKPSSVKQVTIPTQVEPAKVTVPVTTKAKPAPAKPVVKEVKPAVVKPVTKEVKPVQSDPIVKSSNITYEVSSGLALDNVPPKAEPGKCYARCYVPAKYDYVERKVIDKNSTYRTQTIPAQYSTIYDTVIVTAARVKTERVAATYETITERIMIAPSTQRWEKGKADAGCLSNDPKDCQVLCLVDVPAKYKTTQRRVVKTPAYDRSRTIPAVKKVVPRRVQTSPAQTIRIHVPATYKTEMERVKVAEGGYQDWREILCGDKLTSDRIRQIQVALKSAGYNPGPVDNIFGSQTKSALSKYQMDKGLPMGNLNLETLKSLGVKY